MSGDEETLYETQHHPDATSAKDVLAFLLVPERVFLNPGDGEHELLAVRALLGAAKRSALLNWYACHTAGLVRR